MTGHAVVFKLSEDDLAHGALGVIRSLGRLGVTVHLVSRGDPSVLARSRFVADTVALGGDDDPLRVLDAVAAEAAGRPVLFAVGDAAALFVAAHAATLAARYRFPQPPPGVAERLADKEALAALAGELDIDTPRSMAPADRGEVERFVAGTGYPVMVKAIDPREIDWASGQHSVVKVSHHEQLGDVLVAPDGSVRPNLLLQECIPGGSDAIWFFHGYRSDAGWLAAFVGQKLREHPPHAGSTTLGVARDQPVVRERAMRLLDAVGYRGIVDAEFRFDERDGRFLLLDVNPRLGSNFRLLQDAAGLDVVRACYLDLTGEPTVAGAQVEGRKWIVEHLDPATWPAYFGRGRRPRRELPSTLRGVREGAWFAWDDLRPLVAMVGRRGRGILASAVRRPRRR